MAAASRRPNIVVLMADTVMRAALGCYGGAVRTPHLDALARHAHRFEQLYQPANMCRPRRVTWMTGCLPATTQVYVNGFGNNQRRQRTILRACAEAGYQGGYLGLFHCWPGADRDGLDAHQGLDWIYDWQHDPHSWSVPEQTARAPGRHVTGLA